MQAIGIAHQAGVSIALGTDIFSSNPAMGLHWGMNGREFGHLVNAGLTPIEAIESGTANGPSTLGPQAPRSGQLAKGYDADIIAVASSPLEDISVLADPANVTHVWKAGALVKSPVADAQG
jgi:imidazolonepropionase-like amidohydrolase